MNDPDSSSVAHFWFEKGDPQRYAGYVRWCERNPALAAKIQLYLLLHEHTRRALDDLFKSEDFQQEN